MELTLVPITALLLLLSGVGAPSRVPATHTTSAALFRKLFAPTVANKASRVCQRIYEGSSIASAKADGLLALTYRQRSLAFRGRIQARHRAAETPVYQTRFGARTGAYFATAPPAAS